jgi:hypothetical protein
MDDAAERYLDELRRNLGPLPEAERSEAVREIESHIAEGQKRTGDLPKRCSPGWATRGRWPGPTWRITTSGGCRATGRSDR